MILLCTSNRTDAVFVNISVNVLSQEFDKDASGNAHGSDDDDEPGAGVTGWQSVEIDSRPVDLASMPETSVLDEEPVVRHGLGAALLLARKKGWALPITFVYGAQSSADFSIGEHS